jgi:hypothetical protein
MPALIRRPRGCAGSGAIALLIAAALLPALGCSFSIEKPPENPGYYEPINCTTSYAAPTIDSVMAVLNLVAIGIVGSRSGDALGGSSTRNVLVQFDAPLAGAQIGAAIWGFRKVAECRELIASHGPNRRRGYPHSYRPLAPATIEPRTPPPAPGIEPPASPPEPVIEPPAPAAAPAPAAPPAPPAPRARQQMDNE